MQFHQSESGTQVICHIDGIVGEMVSSTQHKDGTNNMHNVSTNHVGAYNYVSVIEKNNTFNMFYLNIGNMDRYYYIINTYILMLCFNK